MKTSIYNTYIPLADGSALLYNALSDKYLALREELQPDQLSRLELMPQGQLRDSLVKIGAIVARDTDEVAAVRDLIRETDYDNTCFHLHVNPTVDCNFRCWYCYEDHRKGSRMEPKTLQAVMRLMERTVASHPGLRQFALSFFGGEPLMGFDNVAVPLIEALERICEGTEVQPSFHFTSNAGLINSRMLDFFSMHKSNFQITLDGHRSHHDKVRFWPATGQGSYDRILHNIRELAARECRVLTRVNYTKDNLRSILDIIDDFRDMPDELKRYISFDLQRVWQDYDGNIDEEVTATVNSYLRSLRTLGYATSTHMVHDLVRNSCYGDKHNYLLVNFDGGVFCCTARDFDDAHQAGILLEDGIVSWRDNHQEHRLSAKFSKPVCHTCRIAPLCGGGCCTQALEHTEPDMCIYRYTDEQKDRMVTDRFEQHYMERCQIQTPC